MALPLAHVGHWAISLLYVLPLFVIAGVATIVTIKERRRGVNPDALESEGDEESEIQRRNS